MRIGIDLFALVPAVGRGGGAHRYVTCLTRALAALDDDLEYVLFVNRLNADMFPSGGRFRQRQVPLSPHRGVWPFRLAWQHLLLPVWAARERLDLMHFPMDTASRLLPCPYVATINDLISDVFYPQYFPDAVSPVKARYQFAAKRRTARGACAVISPSRATADELQLHYGIPRERIQIVPDAADGIFFRDGAPRHSNGARPYVLSVVSLSPHKNISTLIDAFDRARRTHHLPHELRVVGMRGTAVPVIEGQIRDARSRGVPVRYLGFVSDEVLRDEYHSAAAFVFLSLVEGFGLPLLEAMAAEVPVIASNRSCMPEVCADAAILVPPSAVDQAADAIGRVLTDPPLASRLVELGKRRARSFSWAETAVRTRDIYRHAAGNGKH
jgi:glycosyltransferase involved in cell wall biosynthesis